MLVLTPGKHHSGQLALSLSLRRPSSTPVDRWWLAATPYPKILWFIDARWEPARGERDTGVARLPVLIGDEASRSVNIRIHANTIG